MHLDESKPDMKRDDTLAALLHHAGSAVRPQTLWVDDKQQSYRQLDELADWWTQLLIMRGIEPGDRVAYMLPNSHDMVALMFGIWRAGAIAVPVNTRYRLRELQHLISVATPKVCVASRSGPRDYVVELENARNAAAVAEPLDVMDIDDLDSTRKPLDATFRSDGSLSPPAVLGPDDTCMLMFTSGTESNPKACEISVDGLVRTAVTAGTEKFRLTSGDTIWNPSPIFHIGAVTMLLSCIASNAGFASMARFEPDRALDVIRMAGATILFGNFPAINLPLIEQASLREESLARIRLVGSVASEAINRRVQEAFPEAAVISMYGSTELCGVTTMGDPDDSEAHRLATCGRAISGTELRVVSPDDDSTPVHGGAGHLHVRGFNVIRSYFGDAAATQAAFTTDGWFRTGDIVHLSSDGYLEFRGRLKDVLKVGGENVSAAEVEACLEAAPEVRLAQVVGVPDAKYDEVPFAFVELHPHADAGQAEESLRTFCGGRLASFKVPRFYHFVTEWPMSATKVRKDSLRQEAMSIVKARDRSGNLALNRSNGA